MISFGLFEAVALATPAAIVLIGTVMMWRKVSTMIKDAQSVHEKRHQNASQQTSSQPLGSSTTPPPPQSTDSDLDSTYADADDVAVALNRADPNELQPLEVATKMFLTAYPNTIPVITQTGEKVGMYKGEAIYNNLTLSNGWVMEFVCADAENPAVSDDHNGWFIIRHGAALYGNHYSKLIMH